MGRWEGSCDAVLDHVMYLGEVGGSCDAVRDHVMYLGEVGGGGGHVIQSLIM